MGGSKADGSSSNGLVLSTRSGPADRGLPLLAALEALPEAFTRSRLEEVHALVWLDENMQAFRGQQGIFNRPFISGFAHIALRSMLHRAAPGLVSKPALRQLLDSHVTYSAIMRQIRGDGVALMLAAGAVGLGCIAAGTLAILSCKRH